VPTIFERPADLKGAVGQDLGRSDWLEVTQERIDGFADATGDHQWIHVDPERAADGPFGGPIAHGYLTLSLVNHFLPQLIEVRDASMGVNYGTNKVRFPAPVPVGSRIRAGGEIAAVDEVPGGVQVVIRVTVEVESSDTKPEAEQAPDHSPKPACVAETVSRWLD
jgi:acyl dehydratase